MAQNCYIGAFGSYSGAQISCSGACSSSSRACISSSGQRLQSLKAPGGLPFLLAALPRYHILIIPALNRGETFLYFPKSIKKEKQRSTECTSNRVINPSKASWPSRTSYNNNNIKKSYNNDNNDNNNNNHNNSNNNNNIIVIFKQ